MPSARNSLRESNASALAYWAVLIAYVVLTGLAGRCVAQTSPKRPNVVIFLADDMGYSDLGCYGGEVHTPNLDRMARNGLRYTQFYNTTRCWPSRASILTGYYAQQVRRDTLPNVPNTGAGGTRPTWARLLPELLKPGGYRSYHSGKWHLDGTALGSGFDHSYMLLDTDRHFYPKQHLVDDRPIAAVDPDAGYYSTTAIADYAIRWLKDHQKHYAAQPFFEYVAFICPHFPLQAPADDIERYRSRFTAGWDVLRTERLRRMKKLGIVDCSLSDRTPGVPAWSLLGADEQARWSDRMAIHAAMVDRMDQEIGRVLSQIKRMHQLENTIVLFLSDNGASAEILERGDGNDPEAAPGSAKSFLCLEPGWANLSNAPLRKSKIFVHEGGISTPLIVQWPFGIAARGEFRRSPSHIIDLAPTILEVAGITKPSNYNGTPVPTSPGTSLAASFQHDITVPHDYLWWFHEGNRAIRIGDWKLVSEGMNSPWELYNLAADRSETTDLSAIEPERVKYLSERWKFALDEFTALATAPLPSLKPSQ